MFQLNRLQMFKEIAQAGSFTKASLKLRQPKSRLSRNLAALERDLGVQLIYRTTRQFQLTQAGQQLLEQTEPLLRELAQTLDGISSRSQDVRGPIKITVPEDIGTALMGKICYEFMLAYPKVEVHLIATNEVVDLVKDGFDLAIRFGRLKESTLIQKSLGSVQSALVMSPALKQRHAGMTQLSDLEDASFLAFSAHTKSPSLKVTDGRSARSLKLKPYFTANNFFVLKSLALRGVGFTILPTFLVRDELNSGELVKSQWSLEPTPVRALMPHQKETPLRVRRFVEFISRELTRVLT